MTRLRKVAATVEKPEIQEVTSAELGELVLDRGRYQQVEALNTRNNINFLGNGLFSPITMPAGLLYAGRRDQNFTYYFSRGTVMHDPVGGDILLREDWALRVNNKNPADVVGINMRLSATKTPVEPPILEPAQYQRFDSSGYRRQIAYGGRSGDVLKFQYREISADATKPRINQDFEWNLSENAIISYGGAKIEVLDATNSRLSYRVLSGFVDRIP